MPKRASRPPTEARRGVKFSSFTLRLLIGDESVPLFVVNRTLKRSCLNKNATFSKVLGSVKEDVALSHSVVVLKPVHAGF